MNIVQLGLTARSAPYSEAAHRTPTGLRHQRITCANPRCTRSWMAFLKDRRRPIFEGNWACSRSCLSSLVEASIRRESYEAGSADEVSAHRHRIPLGLILLAQGWITHAQLQRALAVQRLPGSTSIGRLLIEQSGLSQDHITRALAMQWGCPVLPAEEFDPAAMALAVPRVLLEALGLLPLRLANRRILYLAFADRLDASAAFAIERMNGLKVISGLIDPASWSHAQRRLCASNFVDTVSEHVADLDAMSRKITSALAAAQPRASRVVRLHQFFWLRMWLETGAMSTPDGGFPRTQSDVADVIYTVGPQQ